MDWEEIKLEYVTSNISYRKLSEKHGVSFNTLAQIACKDKWRDERKKYNEKVAKKTMNKLANKESNKLAKLMNAADSMANVIEGVFKDSTQFNRHLVQTRDKGTNEEGYEYEKWDVEERVFNKVDTKAIKDLTGAMKDLTLTLRNLYNIPTIQEQSAMELAVERLKLDKEKAALNTTDDTETGVVMIAPVLEMEDDVNENQEEA